MNDDTNVMNAGPETQETETTSPPPAKPAPRKVGKAAKRAAKAKAKQSAQSAGPKLAKGQVALKSILADLDLPLDGKLARRKLRAAKFDWHGHNERWIFNAKQAAKVREILGGE
jgi:hypothetical protein